MNPVPDRRGQLEQQDLELHFTRTNGAADEAIEALMDLVGGIANRDLVREMILAALKAGQESASRADLKLMNTTLKEMRFTGKVFAPYRGVRKVTVFGSARTRRDESAYRMAVDLGRQLARDGHMVITGGGPGIMQAVNEGAGPEHSFGVKIRLPFEQEPNPVLENNPRLVTYKYFFNRKVAFLKEADAVVLFPGGFGTLDEAMETLTLVQTGKHDPIPLILIEPEGAGYWTRAMAFFRDALRDQGMVSDSDLALYDYTNSVEECVGLVDAFYRRYHSLRYVNGRLVIRMSSPLPEGRTAALARDFAHILTDGGRLRTTGPLPAEADQPELAGLPRLLVDFNRADFGGLYQLVREINRD